MVLHNRRQFQRLMALEDEDPEEAARTARKIRRRGYLELFAVVVGVVFGLFIFYTLLSDLWWG